MTVTNSHHNLYVLQGLHCRNGEWATADFSGSITSGKYYSKLQITLKYQSPGSWPLVMTHFNATALTFCDWFWRSHDMWPGFLHAPAIAQAIPNSGKLCLWLRDPHSRAISSSHHTGIWHWEQVPVSVILISVVVLLVLINCKHWHSVCNKMCVHCHVHMQHADQAINWHPCESYKTVHRIHAMRILNATSHMTCHTPQDNHLNW
jgi:hypothetical protein